MSSLYQTILTAIQAKIGPVVTPPSAGTWNVYLCAAPKLTMQHALPACLISPPRDLAEKIKRLNFKNSLTSIEHLVFLGTFVDMQAQDPTQLFRRLSVRELIRLNLWEPRSLGIGVDYDVEYDPEGVGGEPPDNPNAIGTWQAFKYVVTAPRSVATNEG
jgi:hypothetical protein